MSKLARAVCVTVTMSMPMLAFAQGATTAFDGNYRGVSRELEAGRMSSSTGSTRSCPPGGIPAPLTIANGIARAGTADNPMEGSVTPQGVLVMRTPAGGKFEGQVDGQGKAAGRFHISCSYQIVWQRRPR